MLGISPKIIINRLNVDLEYRSNCQKKKNFMLDQQQMVDEKVDKLLVVKFIREVYYPNWPANVVTVKKANIKWRIYIEYIDLNKACPKDNFSLSWLDQLMDATLRYRLLSFMDVFSVYNQIRMGLKMRKR